MKRRVVWSDFAKADIRAIIDFLSDNEPEYATFLVDNIERGGNALGTHDTSRPGRMPGTREKSLARISYILSYRLERTLRGEQITILRVIHAARYWPDGRWPE